MDVVSYVQAFNDAVGTGDWDEVIGQFSDDAVMEFVGPPVGPFDGKAAIEREYRRSPPTDTIELAGDIVIDGDVVVAPYRWCGTGEGGTMRFRVADGLIRQLVVTFDCDAGVTGGGARQPPKRSE